MKDTLLLRKQEKKTQMIISESRRQIIFKNCQCIMTLKKKILPLIKTSYVKTGRRGGREGGGERERVRGNLQALNTGSLIQNSVSKEGRGQKIRERERERGMTKREKVSYLSDSKGP